MSRSQRHKELDVIPSMKAAGILLIALVLWLTIGNAQHPCTGCIFSDSLAFLRELGVVSDCLPTVPDVWPAVGSSLLSLSTDFSPCVCRTRRFLPAERMLELTRADLAEAGLTGCQMSIHFR